VVKNTQDFVCTCTFTVIGQLCEQR